MPFARSQRRSASGPPRSGGGGSRTVGASVGGAGGDSTGSTIGTLLPAAQGSRHAILKALTLRIGYAGPDGREAVTTQRQATLADVAAAADVSVATASRVLNGDGRKVGETLRRRITEIAERLDYVPNAHAQALVRANSASVGVLAFDINNPYFTQIIAGIL